MKRIAVIGSGGAGKSTLARQLGAILRIEVIHLDSRFWRPGWVPTPRPEWTQIQADLVKEESWIIDGNYGSTIDVRLAAADTIIFLDFPRGLCLWRVVRRWLQHIGRTRPDMAPGCPEKIDREFINWIWSFPAAERPLLLQKIKQYSGGKQVIILRSPVEVRRFLAEVRQAEKLDI